MIFLPDPLTTSWKASRAVTFLIQPCWTYTVSPFLFNMQITCSAVFRAIHISKISPQIFYLLEWEYNYEIQIQPGPTFVCLSGCKYEVFTQILPHTNWCPFYLNRYIHIIQIFILSFGRKRKWSDRHKSTLSLIDMNFLHEEGSFLSHETWNGWNLVKPVAIPESY